MKKIYLLIACIVFIHLFTQAQVRVNGPVNPSSPLDLYPTHIDSLGMGGFMVVASKAIRNNIPPLRRKKGMLVYVRETDSVYQLNTSSITIPLIDTDWDKFKLGSVGGLTWWGAQSSAPSSPQLNWAYYNSNDKKTYVYSNTGALGVPAWNAIATTYELPETITGNRTFSGTTINLTGGTPVGTQSLVSKSTLKLNINPEEYLHDYQAEFRPRFRRYVLGLDNNGFVSLVRPIPQIVALNGGGTIPVGTNFFANSDFELDIELLSKVPSITPGEEEPVWHTTTDLYFFGGPTVKFGNTAPVDNNFRTLPNSETLKFPPSGIVLAWASIIRTVDGARYVRVRLRNITNATITLTYPLDIEVAIMGMDNGSGPTYSSDLGVGG